MTPEERSLIISLFDRIRDNGTVAKDPQADALIRDAMRQLPDAPYILVQTALGFENALMQADERVRELEAQVADLQAAPRSGGSFLGGGRPFSRGAAPASVPSYGRPPQAEPDYQPAARSPWGSPAAGQPAPAAPASSGGGFLRSAMTTAAGVAGGIFVADSLKGLFGGGHSSGDTHRADTGGTGTPHLIDDDKGTQTALSPPETQPQEDNDDYDTADYDDGGNDDGSYDV